MKKLKTAKIILDVILRIVILICVLITLHSSLKANKNIEGVAEDVSVYKTFISQPKEEKEFLNEF